MEEIIKREQDFVKFLKNEAWYHFRRYNKLVEQVEIESEILFWASKRWDDLFGMFLENEENCKAYCRTALRRIINRFCLEINNEKAYFMDGLNYNFLVESLKKGNKNILDFVKSQTTEWQFKQIYLHYFKKKTSEEIAEIYNVKSGTVRKNISNALKKVVVVSYNADYIL